ncbi:MAG: SusC/RagA family TonB-linked outer membrane protein, partial [Candidatus Cryptobacteroides sp.]
MQKHKDSSGFRRLALLIGLLFPLCISAQQINVKGIVKDAFGDGIPGASVVVKGTTNGTTADVDGKFSLKVSPDAVLEFSCVSYVTVEENVASRDYLEVILKEDTELLNEVLVIGYGTIRKSDLTGAVSAVSNDQLKDSPVPSVGQALQGKVAGVQIIDSGAPGSNVNIKVRGLGSINNCDPLIVIDGVPTDLGLNALNTSDIERIDVLKDASAAAIYGSRGANGVVMITTKRGAEGKGKISVNANASFQNAHNVPQMLNAAQYAQLSNEMMANAGHNTNPEWIDPAALGAGTNWLNEMLRTGIMQNYTVSYSGGNDKAHYYVSGGFLDQSGIVRNVGYKRFTFQSNSDAQVLNWLKFTTNITFSADTKNSGEYSIGSIMGA